MASRAHKHSANKALAFIMASDINDSFGDESSLESSDSHNSEEVPYFRCLEVDKRQENNTQVCFKITTFTSFLIKPLMLALYSE